MNPERLDELCAMLLEGELNEAHSLELQTILESSPELLKRTADLYEIHRSLGQIHQPHDAAQFAQTTLARMHTDREAFIGTLKYRLREAAPRPLKRRFSLFKIAALAAAMVAFALLIYSLLVFLDVSPPHGVETVASIPTQPATRVATLVRFAHARWEPDVTMTAGQRLETGPLRLSTGEAILLFDSGAIVAVQAPARLRLESRGMIRVDQGRLTVRAAGDAAGFTVRTLSGDAQDLGTEFTVSVQVSGSTEVHVLQGDVAWLATAGATPTRVLHAGEAARFDSVDKVQGHPIVCAAQSIDDFVRQLSASLPPAVPTVYEGFDYPPGDMSIETASGGFGWKYPWRLRKGDELTRETDTSSTFSIAPTSLTFPFQQASTGGALNLPPGRSYRVRELADPIDLGRDAIYYISFRVRRVGAPPTGSKERPYFRLTLRNSTDFWTHSVGVGYPESLHPTVLLSGRDTFAAPIIVEPDNTTFWVLKIVARRNHQDEAYLKVFNAGEAISAFEPTPWSVVTDRFPAEGILNLVVVTGSGPVPHVFDELRIGRTWDSVVSKK
ncbi:MAG: FecR domain-containing protein [Planctomycetota bacterium]